MIYFLLVVLSAVIQIVLLRLGKCRPMPAAALVFVIAMFERAIPSMLYAVFAGALIDSFSARFDGLFAVTFTLAAFCLSMLMTFRLRRCLKTALLVLPLPVCAVFALEWALRYLIAGQAYSAHILFSYYLPSAAVSILFIPLFYCVAGALEQKFREAGNEQQKT